MRDVSLYDSDPTNSRPIFLVDFGSEKFSTSGDYGDYAGGEVSLRASADWRQVTIGLPGTDARVTAGLSGDWRGKAVKVTFVPAVEFPRVVEDGYYEDAYAHTGLIEGDPVVLFEGSVDSGGLAGGNRVEYTARHKLLSKASIPGLRFGPPINYHCPPVGKVVSFKSTLYTLEGAR